MVTLTLDDDQVLALVRQLPAERKNWLLRALVSGQWPRWAELADYAGDQVRAVAAARNLDWDQMSDAERAHRCRSLTTSCTRIERGMIGHGCQH